MTTEKGHGREEMRTYRQIPAPKELPGFELWKGLKSIGVVTSRCLRDGKETVEVRYYISSLAVDVKQFAQAVRGHWSIENTCHCTLDMTLREDESRLRERQLRGELRVAEPVRVVATEAASRAAEPGHEASQLRLERHLLDGSCYGSNMFVCAGPVGALGRSNLPEPHAAESSGGSGHTNQGRP